MSTNRSKHLTPGEIAGLAVITLVGAALRFYDLDGKSLWGDEINMIWFMTGERDLAKSSGNALAYLPILRLAAWLGGSDFLFRLPAVLASIPTIPLLFVVADHLFGRSLAFVAATLLALSPYHLVYAQEAHAYALFCLLSLLAFYLFWRAYHEDDLRLWLVLAVVVGVTMHFHLYTAFALLSGAAVLLLLLARDRRLLRLPTRQALGVAVAFFWIVLVLVAPLARDWVLPLGSKLIQKASGQEMEVKPAKKKPRFEIDLDLFKRAFKELTVWRLPHHRLAHLSFALAFLGLFYLWRQDRFTCLALVLWIVVPLLPVAIFSRLSNIDFGSRRIIFILPMYLLMIAAGLVAVAVAVSWLIERLGLRLQRSAAIAFVTAAFAILVMAPLLVFYYLQLENSDFKRLARLIEREAREGDLVVVWKPEYLQYYDPGPVEILNIARTLRQIPSRYLQAERIWYIRPRTVDRWPLYKPFAEWIADLGALRFLFGGDMLVSFHRRQPASPEAMLQERAELLEAAVELKPNRPYTQTSLANVYKQQGRLQEARRAAQIGLEMRYRGRFYLSGGRDD